MMTLNPLAIVGIVVLSWGIVVAVAALLYWMIRDLEQ